MAGFSQYIVRLHRDALNTPWGFRLQGGKDVGQPLSIQRVFSGTAAEGDLQRGDLLTAIENRPTDTLTHKEAQNIIKAAGGSILLHIQRQPSASLLSPVSPKQKLFQPKVLPSTHPKPQPKPMSFHPGHNPTVQRHAYGGPSQQFGVDYSKKPSSIRTPARQTSENHYMLNRVQYNLDNAIHSPGSGVGGRYDPEMVITTPQYIPQKAPVPMYDEQLYNQQQYQQSMQSQHQPNVREEYNYSNVQYEQHYSPQHHSRQHSYEGQAAEPFRPFFQQTASFQHQSVFPVEEDEDDYEHVPVSERKKAFMKKDATPKHIQPQLKKSHPKAPRITQQNRTPDWNADDSRNMWSNVEPVRPFPVNAQPPTPENPHSSPNVLVPGKPAWRGTLKSAGYKTWSNDAALDETFKPLPATKPMQPKPPSHVEQPRCVSFSDKDKIGTKQNIAFSNTPQPVPVKPLVAPGGKKSVPINSTWKSSSASVGPNRSPRIVNLQYNSPIEMYSNVNVQETLHGQVSHISEPKVKPTPFGEEPRDWEQSAVYRMVHASDSRNRQPTGQYHHQQNESHTVQQNVVRGARKIDDDVGVSDF